jgi:hypothetical protein
VSGPDKDGWVVWPTVDPKPKEPPPDRLDEPGCDCKDCREQRGK